jgi:biotin carboxyl carrier protein
VKYFVEIYDKQFEFDVEELPDGTFRVIDAEGEHTVDYLETTSHEASLLIDGCSTTYWFHGENGNVLVSDGRDTFKAHAVDERARVEESIFGQKQSRGGGEIRSIMPGIVTRVLVSEGQVVEHGTPLLCIEAMKMENEIKSEVAGAVKRILVAPGKTVNAGEVLVEIGV